MNRRNILGGLLASFAMTTGLARTSIEIVDDDSVFSMEKLMRAKRVLDAKDLDWSMHEVRFMVWHEGEWIEWKDLPQRLKRPDTDIIDALHGI